MRSNKNKISRLLILLVFCLLLPASCKKNTSDSEADTRQLPRPDEPLPTQTLDLAGQSFTVELAFTRQSCERGLMFRSQLAADSGMLFVFDKSRVRSFYMANCLIDLDVIFLDAGGQIVKIATMPAPVPGQPLQYYSSDVPVKYALELPAGTAERLSLKVGQAISLPRRILTIIPEPD